MRLVSGLTRSVHPFPEERRRTDHPPLKHNCWARIFFLQRLAFFDMLPEGSGDWQPKYDYSCTTQ